MGRFELMYSLITIYIVIIYISISVQYETVFDRCVPEIVCRCVISLSAVGSWDLVGQCLHGESCVCPDVCVVCATEVHGWEAPWPDEGTRAPAGV